MNAGKILAVLLVLAALPARAFEVRIVQPGPGEAILGEVEVRVEMVPPTTPVERVEVFLDGEPAGVAERTNGHFGRPTR